MTVMDIKRTTKLVLGIGLAVFAGASVADGWDPASNAGARGSIANTRHDMTMDYTSGGGADVGFIMNGFRNDYGAICVYCHTPHGGNTQIQAPLWNRTINNGTYTIYDKPTTLMRPIGQPGPNSLTCLSCHDGTIAIDSVLNMPGSGLNPVNSTLANNSTGTSNLAFLDQWSAAGNEGPPPGTHATLGPDLGNGSLGGTCGTCHFADGAITSSAGGFLQSYRAFMIGTDLRNDHPVGVLFPDAFTPVTDFNEPNVKLPGRMAFFDGNGNNHADPDEVRLYDTGDGYEVECASCHDPHGVPSGGSGTNTRFSPSFLRVNNGIGGPSTAGNAGIVSNGPSALCLTCHAK